MSVSRFPASGGSIDAASALAAGIPGPWVSAPAGVAAQDVTLNMALAVGSGDLEVVAEFIAVASGITYTVQPNGSTASQFMNYVSVANTTGGAGTGTSLVLADSFGAGSPVNAHFFFRPMPGATAYSFSSIGRRGPDGANGAVYHVDGYWGAGPLTSVVIHASAGANIQAGWRIRGRWLNNA